MPNFIRAENEVDYFYTSGTTNSGGVFQVGGGQGTVLVYIRWDHNGLASGVVVSVLDTQSGTLASGLWLVGSGATEIQMLSPKFTSGMDGVGANAKPIYIPYNVIMNSGLAVMISGGGANVVRAFIGYISGQA